MKPDEILLIEQLLNKYKDKIIYPYIVDVGSRYINGNSKKVCEKVFVSPKWIGIDYCEGQDVTIVCDAHNLFLPSETVNVVISTNLLEHVTDPYRVVQEMKRILVPHGLILIIVPSFGAVQHHEDGKSTGDTNKEIRDFWRLSLECLKNLFEDFFILELGNIIKQDNPYKGHVYNDIYILAEKI